MICTEEQQAAIRAVILGDEGEVHPMGKVFMDWLRDVCHWGDAPLDPAHYSGDLVLLGRVLGKQEVFTAVLDALGANAASLRMEHVEEVSRLDQLETDYDGTDGFE